MRSCTFADNSLDVACIQCDHSDLQQPVPFVCVRVCASNVDWKLPLIAGAGAARQAVVQMALDVDGLAHGDELLRRELVGAPCWQTEALLREVRLLRRHGGGALVQ